MGLVPRSVKMIFEMMSDRMDNVKVTLSCFEIHIETVRDLLDPSNEQSQIMTNQGKFKPLELEVRSFSDVEFVMAKASENRKTAPTAMN